MKTVEQGAATSLWRATSPRLDGLGEVYCEDCDIALLNGGESGRKGVAAWAADEGLAVRLLGDLRRLDRKRPSVLSLAPRDLSRSKICNRR